MGVWCGVGGWMGGVGGNQQAAGPCAWLAMPHLPCAKAGGPTSVGAAGQSLPCMPSPTPALTSGGRAAGSGAHLQAHPGAGALQDGGEASHHWRQQQQAQQDLRCAATGGGRAGTSAAAHGCQPGSPAAAAPPLSGTGHVTGTCNAAPTAGPAFTCPPTSLYPGYNARRTDLPQLLPPTHRFSGVCHKRPQRRLVEAVPCLQHKRRVPRPGQAQQQRDARLQSVHPQ